MGKDTAKTIEEWADKRIKCTLPDETEDPELAALVRKQVHGHRPTCQREGKQFRISAQEKKTLSEEQLKVEAENRRCRFHYPKPLQTRTELVISESLLDQQAALLSVGESMVKATREQMEGRSEEEIEAAVKKIQEGTKRNVSKLLQSNSVELKMKRGKGDECVNNYNPAILR